MTRRLRLTRLFADRRARRITFIKKNHEKREMTFRYQGGAIVGPIMTVWDIDVGAIRRVNLDTIQGCGVVLKAKKQS